MENLSFDPTTCFLGAAKLGNMPLLKWMARYFEERRVPYGTVKNSKGFNALHYAADAGQTNVCKFLIEELNFDIDVESNCGLTPLAEAIVGKHLQTTNFLIDSGADVNRRNDSGSGLAPLHHAAAKSSSEIAKLLVSKGADLCASTDRGTPLHYAAVYGNHDILEYLLMDLKLDPNPVFSSLDTSPLSLAMNARSMECTKLLLKAGADPNRPSYLKTPLIFAACVLDVGFIQCLLKAGADPNLEDFVGLKPLEYAAWWGHPESVKVLFPVTCRIACFSDWSVHGIMLHTYMRTSRVEFESKLKEVFVFGKAKGGEAFARKNYLDAINWYTQAIDAHIKDAAVLSNRSLCYSKMIEDKANNGRMALKDAHACIALEPGWAKGHYREGAAWMLLDDFRKAAEAFSRAVALDPSNKDIKEAHRAALAELNKAT